MPDTHFDLKNKISNCMDLLNAADLHKSDVCDNDLRSKDIFNCFMHLLMTLLSGFDKFADLRTISKMIAALRTCYFRCSSTGVLI